MHDNIVIYRLIVLIKVNYVETQLSLPAVEVNIKID